MRYRCPRCGSADLAGVDLEKTGTIQTLTRVLQTGPDSMISVPYYVALIQIDSGPIIEAVSASELGESEISAGTRITLLLEVLDKDEDGDEVAAYRFSTKPVAEVTK